MAKDRIISVIDIGSSSTVLLVASCVGSRIEPVNEVYAITRLFDGLEQSSVLSENSISFTLRALDEMKRISAAENAEDIVVTVASGIKKAENKSEFLVRCHNELSIFPQVLSTKDEEKYSYFGVVQELAWDGPIFVVDVGGSSSRIAYGSRNLMVGAHTIPVGAFTLDENFKLSKGAWIHNWIQAKSHIRKILFSCIDEINSWVAGRKILVVASGGTATSYARLIISNETPYDRKQINSTTSFLKQISAMSRQISRIPLDKRRRMLQILDPARAQTLPAGLLIFSSILDFFNLDEFRISANGLRYGVLANYIKQ